jgi:RNA polymerase sigma-70 factor (ECF subfamily)
VGDGLELLIRLAQGGDVPALETLVAAHLALVRRFARAFSASDVDADDLAQDALVRACRSLRSFRRDSSFSTWLFTLVRSAFLDAARGRAARARALEQPLAAADAERGGGVRPDEAIERDDERRRLWRALRQVAPEFRVAVVLFDLEGRSHEEIAAIEGVAVGTVKSRLHRGRARLRRLLEASAAHRRPRAQQLEDEQPAREHGG